jgi:hypothetical protein
MRGNDDSLWTGMFGWGASEDRTPAGHPLRGVRELTGTVLREMSADFDGSYSKFGGSPIPRERLLRALLLQVVYSVRSERLSVSHSAFHLGAHRVPQPLCLQR